jgi:S1-C subfamily serine protease
MFNVSRIRRIAISVLIGFTCIIPASVANAKSYKNCYLLQADFPYGVAQGFYRVGSSQAKIDRKTYLRNKKLDFDKDGIACEIESLQTPPTTTTTPQTQLTDLKGFVNTYGKSVVTVICKSSQGSGVSVSVTLSTEQTSAGMTSFIATNHHVISACTSGDWKSRVVTIKAAGVEYVGYVWGWENVAAGEMDIATIVSSAPIPPVSSLWSIIRPQIGDTVIAIGSTSGIAGTSAQGAIAGVSGTEILSTAQAGFGSSGGALFNKSGQMIGLIQGSVGLLLSAIPVTQFVGSVYGSTATPITWK